MRPRLRELVQRLVDEGTLSSDDAARLQRSLAAAAAHDTSAPWYVRLLSAFGAWVSAGLFVLVLALTGLWQSGGACLVLGVLALVAASAIRASVRHDFAVQVCLALAVTGEALLLFGAADSLHLRDESLALAAVMLNLVVLIAFPDPVGRFLAAAFAIASMAFALHELRDDDVVGLFAAMLAGATVLTWESGPQLGRWWRNIRAPLGVALAAGFLGLLAYDAAARESERLQLGGAATLGLVLVSLALAARILLAHRVSLASEAGVAALVGVAGLGAVSWSTPGILGAVMVLVLGYHRREVLLTGLAVAFFVGFAGWYYYSLELTLLQKAAVLILSGGLVLGARRYLRWRMPAAPPAPAEGAAA